MNIEKELFKLQDKNYQAFSRRTSPSVNPDMIIGVRVPCLRQLGKKIIKENKSLEFISDVPHHYFEELHIHNYVLNEIKDYDFALAEVNKALPYMCDWSLTDELLPKAFIKNKTKLIKEIKKWLKDKKPFTIRFGILMLMKLYLDDNFLEDYFDLVIDIKSDDYYVNMAKAWYFAESLIKQYDLAINVIESKKLDVWIHNKAIQKARESFRISNDRKEYLKSLRIEK